MMPTLSRPGSDGDDDPIAIVSMGCRYPGGVQSPADLWQVVSEGRDVTSQFPTDRGWEALAGVQGASTTHRGGFLDEAADFDARFFGISPREAEGMDPQQRVLMEVAWETLERGGIPRSSLEGASLGVFVGAMAQEYGPRLFEDNEETAGYRITGSSPSLLSGRIAYFFGSRGPAVTVDTACSSSLVAVHLAARALRADDCDFALAGGVAVMAGPGMFVDFSRQQGLSRDGRCRSFSADADGTGWSEGAGLLLLERLSRARRLQHRVLALVRGSATNSDGASNGITAPSGPAQEEVILRALADAGLDPADVDAVEAHGTGTALGDPIEARALAATYGRAHVGAQPVSLGSLKSNIGHAQAAAGVGGVIKMVQAMAADTLPPTLHVKHPTPHVEWDTSGLELATASAAWPRGASPRRAGVSAFGISGANAHVILEEAPPVPAQPLRTGADPEADSHEGTDARTPAPGPIVWPLSAPEPQSLTQQAQALLAHLNDRPDLSPVDIAHTLRLRTRFGHRAIVIGDSREDLMSGLARVAGGRPLPPTASRYRSPQVLRSQSRRDSAGPVFVFPGQGTQWVGMGLELMAHSPVFREAMHECEEELRALCGWRLRDALAGEGLSRVEVIQPALFAVMTSLARLWQSLGVRPAAVVGHSQGEIAAAFVAGALSLPDACRVVALRSQALIALHESGTMVSVPLDAHNTQRLIDGVPGAASLSIAALNAPTVTVVAGDVPGAEALLAGCERLGIDARRVEVDYASHTPAVQVLRAQILSDLRDITPHQPAVPMHSTLTGSTEGSPTLDARYWYENLLNPVQFEPVVQALITQGHRTFVECSPHPVLVHGLEESLESAGAQGRPVPTLRRGNGGLGQFLSAAASLSGVEPGPDISALQPAGRLVDLPTYQFAHSRYWLNPTAAANGHTTPAPPEPLPTPPIPTPLVGEGLWLPDGRRVLPLRVSQAYRSWLGDHQVEGRVILPATALLVAASSAGAQIGRPFVRELVLHHPVDVTSALPDLLIVLQPGPAGSDWGLTLSGRLGEGGWVTHASGLLGEASAGVDAEPPLGPARAGQEWPPTGAEAIDLRAAYSRLRAQGYEYGPAFRGLRAAWRVDADVFAEVALPADLPAVTADAPHPALLDAALHAWLLREDHELELPFSWQGVRLPPRDTALRVHLKPAGSDGLEISFLDHSHALVGHVRSLSLRPAQRRTGTQPIPEPAQLFDLTWAPVDAAAHEQSSRWVSIASPQLGAVRDLPDVTALADSLAEPLAEPLPPFVAVELSGEPGVDVAEGALSLAARTTDLLKAWVGQARLRSCRLAVLTRHAVACSQRESVGEPGDAVVTGLVRAAQSEYPGLFVLIDVDDDASLAALPAAALGPDPEIALRAGRLFVPRLRPSEAPGGTPPDHLSPPAARNWRLDVTRKGTLEDLALIEAPEALAELEPGQVRIAVRAAGLNFRDVMVGLGLVPTEKTMGAEGAGVITEVGRGGERFSVGDRVFGVFERALGPIAVADERTIRPMPTGWRFAQAAGVPIAFITAYQCLVDVASTRPGDVVLIHTATGGVGLAAIQLAQHLGAQVFATASPAKHEILRAYGVSPEHMASSRSLEFADRFREVTGGYGMDVVLNSLRGKALDASLGLLAPGGRFAEMGKTDLRAAENLHSQYPGVRYAAYNILDVAPMRIGEVLDLLLALFEQGALRHLPLRAWDVRLGRVPLRTLSRARHRGKLVLTMPAAIDPDRPALITGGTGGLGLALARHLATRHSLRHLVLLSRSGPAGAGVQALQQELGACGVRVEARACDVSDLAGLREIVGGLKPATVIHAAGVLEDCLLADLSVESLHRVLRPKLLGAWNLHLATQGEDVGAFVLFSSIAGLVGNPGQANYAAANAFLDALARHRRDLGLPAVSLAWGLWQGDTGMTSHLGKAQISALARIGIAPMPQEEGLELFDQGVLAAEAIVAPLRHVVESLPPFSRAAHVFGRADRLAQAPAAILSAATAQPLVEAAVQAGQIAPASAEAVESGPRPDLGEIPRARREQVILAVRGQAAEVLGYPDAEAVGVDDNFKELGYDSLLSVDLRNRLNAELGLQLPVGVVLENPTPRELAHFINQGLDEA